MPARRMGSSAARVAGCFTHPSASLDEGQPMGRASIRLPSAKRCPGLEHGFTTRCEGMRTPSEGVHTRLAAVTSTRGDVLMPLLKEVCSTAPTTSSVPPYGMRTPPAEGVFYRVRVHCPHGQCVGTSPEGTAACPLAWMSTKQVAIPRPTRGTRLSPRPLGSSFHSVRPAATGAGAGAFSPPPSTPSLAIPAPK